MSASAVPTSAAAIPRSSSPVSKVIHDAIDTIVAALPSWPAGGIPELGSDETLAEWALPLVPVMVRRSFRHFLSLADYRGPRQVYTSSGLLPLNDRSSSRLTSIMHSTNSPRSASLDFKNGNVPQMPEKLPLSKLVVLLRLLLLKNSALLRNVVLWRKGSARPFYRLLARPTGSTSLFPCLRRPKKPRRSILLVKLPARRLLKLSLWFWIKKHRLRRPHFASRKTRPKRLIGPLVKRL